MSSFTLDNGLDVVVIPDRRRAGRHPHDLVPQRLGGRSARPVRHRAFPRAPDVQGHGEASGRRVLEGRLRPRRPGERLHLLRLHGLLPARRPRAPQDHDGLRGRPHDRPRARRRVVAPERDVVLEERRMRVEPIRRRSSPRRWRRRSSCTIPTACRSSAGCTRSRARTASTRCPTTAASTRPRTPSWWSPATSTGRRGAPPRRRHLRPHRAARRAPGARAPAGARARAARHIAVADPEGRAADPAAALSRAVLPHGRRTATATRSNSSPRCSAAARPPISTASSSWSAASPSIAGAWYMASAMEDTRFSVYAVPARASRSRRSRRRSTRS